MDIGVNVDEFAQNRRNKYMELMEIKPSKSGQIDTT